LAIKGFRGCLESSLEPVQEKTSDDDIADTFGIAKFVSPTVADERMLTTCAEIWPDQLV
jgi:hypothetical protein